MRLMFRFVLGSRRQRGDERNTPSCLSFSRPDGLSLWVVDPERRAVATLSFVPHSAVSRLIPSFEHMVRW